MRRIKMNKEHALKELITKEVKKCLNEIIAESSMGKLSGDASDVLDGMTMMFKNKSAKELLKMIKTDPKYSEVFLPEMQEMDISDSEMLSYIQDSQFIHNYVGLKTAKREGIADMTMPPHIDKWMTNK